ncbi:MAG: HAD hydrolase family protein [Longimicrobiales bacterium]|nr:HAD hydrolase family protein [Longimicrobiales bacterium]
MAHSRRQLPEAVATAGSTIPRTVAERVRVVVLDVDGVLTDGGVYMGQSAVNEMVEFKRFDIQDGLGIKLLEADGIRVIWISGRVSRASVARAKELGVELHQDAASRKLAILQNILDRDGIAWREVAMLADDLPDLAIFRRMGLKCAVANAQPEIADEADWVSERRGGHGAVREFARVLLRARGSWDGIVEAWVARTAEMIDPGERR